MNFTSIVKPIIFVRNERSNNIQNQKRQIAKTLLSSCKKNDGIEAEFRENNHPIAYLVCGNPNFEHFIYLAQPCVRVLVLGN